MIQSREEIAAILDSALVSTGCTTARFRSIPEGKALSALSEVDRIRVTLHRADRAQQEARWQNGIEQLNKQNLNKFTTSRRQDSSHFWNVPSGIRSDMDGQIDKVTNLRTENAS